MVGHGAYSCASVFLHTPVVTVRFSVRITSFGNHFETTTTTIHKAAQEVILLGSSLGKTCIAHGLLASGLPSLLIDDGRYCETSPFAAKLSLIERVFEQFTNLTRSPSKATSPEQALSIYFLCNVIHAFPFEVGGEKASDCFCFRLLDQEYSILGLAVAIWRFEEVLALQDLCFLALDSPLKDLLAILLRNPGLNGMD